MAAIYKFRETVKKNLNTTEALKTQLVEKSSLLIRQVINLLKLRKFWTSLNPLVQKCSTNEN